MAAGHPSDRLPTSTLTGLLTYHVTNFISTLIIPCISSGNYYKLVLFINTLSITLAIDRDEKGLYNRKTSRNVMIYFLSNIVVYPPDAY